MPDSILCLCDSRKCSRTLEKARLSLGVALSFLKSWQLLGSSSLKMCCCNSLTQLEVRWLTSRTGPKIPFLSIFCNELLVVWFIPGFITSVVCHCGVGGL